jgi:HEAT repeat protein
MIVANENGELRMMQAAQTPPPAPRQGPPQAAPAPLPTLEQSFELLKEFKLGTDSTVLIPIERAVTEVQGNETARAALEKRLVAYLGSTYPSVTRSFVCRQLVLIGSAASVPAVTPLILDEELSVHARNVLEHIPGAESEKALRDALGQTKGRTRIGVINSVAARRDAVSTPVLIKILSEDPQSAAAAAKALGEIGTPEATRALAAARGKGPALVQHAVVDGTLIGADRLVAVGQRSQAIALLEGLTEASQPEHVRRAARRTLSAVTRKS